MPISPAFGIAAHTAALGVLRQRMPLGGADTPPGYDPATDDLWLAEAGYLFSDVAGLTPLVGAGTARSWRSLRGTLAVEQSGSGVVWDGDQELTFTGTQWFATVTFARPQPETIFAVCGGVSTDNYVTDGVDNFRFLHAQSSVVWRMFGGSSVSIGVSSTLIPNVVSGVFNSALSTIRVNGAESSGDSGSLNVNGLIIGRRHNAAAFWQGTISAIWLAPGRAFDVTQRAANEEWFADRYGISI